MPGHLGQQTEVIYFEHDGMRFTELTSPQQLHAAYELRYRICVEKLHWVEGDPATRTESDEFDAHSYHFGCYSGQELVGYLRLTKETAPPGTMTRTYFPELWHRDPHYPKARTADITRLLLDRPRLPNPKSMLPALRGLYRLAYGRSQLCRPTIQYWYFITTPKLLGGLRWRLGLPVKKIGQGITSDGKMTYVAGLSLRRGGLQLLLLAPWRLNYFRSVARHTHPLPGPSRH
ncbi:MAG TPA: GNAT family N-acyltransferase [Candidatus Saccharimonadia bacterium]|nr:GNAT family N-acyltransferase [Candidatus Saccharimonadia bacterium]